MLEKIAATVFVFGLLVFVHELGHFITAKLTGMRVDEFAIGFGPRLVHFRVVGAVLPYSPVFLASGECCTARSSGRRV